MKYNIILADPPWAYKDKRNNDPAYGAMTYKTMPLDEIKALPVKDIADTNCMLFLWATFPNLQPALDVIKAWGFTYKTVAFNWVKTNKKNGKPFFGCGFYTKCLTGDTKVYIKDCQSGKIDIISLSSLYDKWDNFEIWTPSGFKTIHNMVKNKADCVKIRTPLSEIIASRNHKFPFKTITTPRYKGTNRRYKKPVVLCDTVDFIRSKKGRAIEQTVGSTNLLFSPREIPSGSEVSEFRGIPLTYDIGWLIGMFLAEGYCKVGNSLNFTLHSKEIEYYEKIKRIVESFGYRGDRYFNYLVKVQVFKHKDRNAMEVYFTKGIFFDLFSNFILNLRGGAHGKRLNIFNILNAPLEFRRGLIEGMYDGDGTKTKYKVMGLCNEGLVDDLRIIYHTLGIPTSKYKGHCTLNGKHFKSYMLALINRSKRIEYDGNTLQTITINKFTDMGNLDTFDLTVDGGLFIANDIVTHNSNAEVCLLGVKGKPIKASNRVSSIVITPREEHSKKPDVVRERIVELCGDIPRIEMFARQQTPGWDVYGNEVANSIKFNLRSTCCNSPVMVGGKGCTHYYVCGQCYNPCDVKNASLV